MNLGNLFGLGNVASAVNEAFKSDGFKKLVEQQVTGFFGIGNNDEAIKAQMIASKFLAPVEKDWYRALDLYVGEVPAKRVREILGAIRLVPIIEKDPKLKKDGTPVVDKDGELVNIVREKLPQFDADDPRIKFIKNLVEEMQGAIGITSDVRPSTLTKEKREKALEVGKDIYTAIGAFESTLDRSINRIKGVLKPAAEATLNAAHSYAKESMGVDDFQALAARAKAAGISTPDQYRIEKGIPKPTNHWIVLLILLGVGFAGFIGFGIWISTKL